MMLRAAWDATGNRHFIKLQKKAFDWFLGDNDLGTPVYDFKTKGCSDGLMQTGLNLNQGAESTLCFLLSLLCIVESYAAGAGDGEEVKPADEDAAANVALAAIKDVAARSKTPERVIKVEGVG